MALPPGLEDLSPRGIAPIDVNDRGEIVGTYEDPDGAVHGFLLRRGRPTKIDVPGAKAPSPRGSTTAARSPA